MPGDVVSISATMYSDSGALDGVTPSDASREEEHVINTKKRIITATYRITQLYTDLVDFCEKESRNYTKRAHSITCNPAAPSLDMIGFS